MRPTVAEINLDNLRYNFSLAKRIVGCGVDFLAIVKADAYGHGAVSIARVLVEEGASMLGVATVEEALELRESGISAPIVILGGVYPDEVKAVLTHDLTPALFSIESAASLNDCAKREGKAARYHLKVDTGMNRLGVIHDCLTGFLECLSGFPYLVMEGVFSHFASADCGDVAYTNWQLSVFKSAIIQIIKDGFRPRYFHIANSAGLLAFPESHFNMVRPGIMLYGASSYNGSNLMPVMKLKTRVIEVKKLPVGSPVSYGGTFVTKRPSRIAILPIGYADGYMRALSNRAFVSIRGKRAPVVGSVCMDLTIIDITDIEDARVGDEVILFGDEVVSVGDVAQWGGTISYELLSITGKRVPRVYV
jgi:alanine racemase